MELHGIKKMHSKRKNNWSEETAYRVERIFASIYLTEDSYPEYI
jgi:hypothetical protein